jgi:hypothetical protein
MKLITVGSRAANQIAQMYGRRTLPLLQANHPLARLFMNRAEHEQRQAIPAASRTQPHYASCIKYIMFTVYSWVLEIYFVSFRFLSF